MTSRIPTGFSIPALLQALAQVVQDRCGRAPDAPPRRHRLVIAEHVAHAPADAHRLAMQVGRRQQPVQRHLEHFGHFARIGPGDEVGGDFGHQRQHAEAGNRGQRVQPAEHPHLPPLQANLLLRLAQGRVGGAAIVGLDPAAGKTDLPRMVAKAFGAPGQQHVPAGVRAAPARPAPRPRAARGRVQQVFEFGEVPGRLQRCRRQRMQHRLQLLRAGGVGRSDHCRCRSALRLHHVDPVHALGVAHR